MPAVANKALERQLATAGRRVMRLQRDLAQATVARDDLILAASKAGMTRRAVASLAGVTVGRVQQIIDARRS